MVSYTCFMEGCNKPSVWLVRWKEQVSHYCERHGKEISKRFNINQPKMAIPK